MTRQDFTEKTRSEKTRSVSIPQAQLDLQSALELRFGGLITRLPSLAWAEYGLAYLVARENALAMFGVLKEEPQFKFEMLVDITAVDWMDQREPRFDVVYQLMSLSLKHRLCLKIVVDEDTPVAPVDMMAADTFGRCEVDSVRELWAAANFLEREVWDMYGIRFRGHGDLRRILMYDEFVGHPLRKDYPLKGEQPRVTLRSSEGLNDSTRMPRMHREPLVPMPSRRKGVC